MQVSELFDMLYRTYARYWWLDKNRYAANPDSYPHSLLTQLTLRLLACEPPGRVLDLGAGEGTDSIRLALLGYEVDAVDISNVAAAKICQFADEAGVKVNVAAADVSAYEPGGLYDVIICNGVLHYLECKESVIRRMQDATKPGGINVVSLWSSYTPVPECHNGVPSFPDDEDGVVSKLYQGWSEELFYVERDKIDTSHVDLPQHSHSHIKLIARKKW
jgi:tellurite methyltransferase